MEYIHGFVNNDSRKEKGPVGGCSLVCTSPLKNTVPPEGDDCAAHVMNLIASSFTLKENTSLFLGADAGSSRTLVFESPFRMSKRLSLRCQCVTAQQRTCAWLDMMQFGAFDSSFTTIYRPDKVTDCVSLEMGICHV